MKQAEDILSAYRDTPVGELLGYHNLGWPHRLYDRAQLLIVTCMDSRIALRTPANFAYVVRVGGAHARLFPFNVSYVIAMADVRAICIIGHSDCAMIDVRSKRASFVHSLVEKVGWARSDAESHFEKLAGIFEVTDPVSQARLEARWLRQQYPSILVAPLYYQVEDGALLQIRDGQRDSATRSSAKVWN